jgi:CobQ-like glutamine amidotransferase family enzyme
MITFHTFLPDRLNLNGDQANIFVLQKRLEWQGIASRIVPVNSLAQLDDIDPQTGFLLVGHGSQAAMRTVEPMSGEFRDKVFELAHVGLAGLAVGSGYELLFPDFARGTRRSDYANVPAENGLPELFGYVNTDTNLPVVTVVGDSFICTMVHGPVLARTPQLADLLLQRMGVAVRETSESSRADAYADKAQSHN